MGWNHQLVVATQIFLEFSSRSPQEMIQSDHIFQRGWFNHQLDKALFPGRGGIAEGYP